MADGEPFKLDIGNDPHLLFVPGPDNLPPQSDLFRACTAVSARVINQMADLYGRDFLFANTSRGNVSHEELLMLMEARANTQLRASIAKGAVRVLTPLIQYQDLFLPANKRTVQENQTVINDIQNEMLAVLRDFGVEFKIL